MDVQADKRTVHLDVGVERARSAPLLEIDVQVPPADQGRGARVEAPLHAAEEVVRKIRLVGTWRHRGQHDQGHAPCPVALPDRWVHRYPSMLAAARPRPATGHANTTMLIASALMVWACLLAGRLP